MDINPKKGGHRESLLSDFNGDSRFKKIKDICLHHCSYWRRWIAILVALVILWKGLVLFGLLPSQNFPATNPNKWQAVFLTNNQVYFGHIKNAGRDYTILNNVYYLRVSQQLQPSASQQQISIVKLGDEIHKPEDTMYIPKNQIIFWENMQDDSAVVQAIKNAEGK